MMKQILLAFWFVLALVVPAQAQLTTSLVEVWELEEASGSRDGAHASLTLTDNNTVAQGTGKVGNAADFESSSGEFLSRASEASLQMGDIAFTICAWVNPESFTSDMGIVTKDDDAPSSRDYTLDIIASATNKPRFYVNGGGTAIVTHSGTLSTSTWYFICAWHDPTANTVNIQVNNGTAESAASGGVVPDTSSAVFMIGAREYAANEQYFDGLIDQVAIWKRLLTDQERTDLYNSGNGLSYAGMGGGGGGAATPKRLLLLGVGASLDLRSRREARRLAALGGPTMARTARRADREAIDQPLRTPRHAFLIDAGQIGASAQLAECVRAHARRPPVVGVEKGINAPAPPGRHELGPPGLFAPAQVGVMQKGNPVGRQNAPQFVQVRTDDVGLAMDERIEAEREVNRLRRQHRERAAVIHKVGDMGVVRETLAARGNAGVGQINNRQPLAERAEVIGPAAIPRRDFQDVRSRNERLNARPDALAPLAICATEMIRPFVAGFRPRMSVIPFPIVRGDVRHLRRAA